MNKPEQILQTLETTLKELIADKQELKTKFQTKLLEIQTWFSQEWQEATKLENKFILLWDYWQREVKIFAHQQELQNPSNSIQRQEISRRLGKLIALNASLEKGFKDRQIAPELVESLRKKIGAWEEEND